MSKTKTLSPQDLEERRTRTFVALSALFFAAMVLLNVIGLTRFVQMGPLALAVGVLPYPLTFLVTDLISEIFGKDRANFVVWVGLGLNLFVLLVLFIGQSLPSVAIEAQPPWQTLNLEDPLRLATGESVSGSVQLFYLIYTCSAGAVVASMLSYLAAQFCDVRIYHFLKTKTQGRHLWLRNNGSTLVSQLIDSFVVISVTFGMLVLEGSMTLQVFSTLLFGNYLFKMTAALLDTLPFYYCVALLRRYLKINEDRESSH